MEQLMNGNPKRGRRRTNQVLCDVDREIVRIIALNRFSTAKDLKRSIANLPPNYNINRRLISLKTVGILEALIGDSGKPLGCRLTKAGLRFARQALQIPDALVRSRPSFKTQYDHDRIVNDARRILTGSSAVRNFLTELELRTALGKDWRAGSTSQAREWKVPDGLFSLETKNGTLRVALEVELSQKARARYAKIMRALITSRSFDVVFFLCRDEKLAQVIRSELNRARASDSFVKVSNRNNGFYFAKLDELREHGLDAPWAGETNRFTLREIEAGWRAQLACTHQT
jgi:hypothetical protein